MDIHCDVCEKLMNKNEPIHIMKIDKQLYCGHLTCVMAIKKKLNPKNNKPFEWEWIEGEE
jgi:hypothetical protein